MSDSVLKWQEGSISQAFVSKSASGENYAVLKANPAKVGEVAKLQNDLFEKHNLLSYPKTIDGEHCLVVHGFGKTEELTNALTALDATSGQPNIDKMKEDPQSMSQRWDSFRRNQAVTLSGAAGLGGHGFMALRGWREQDHTKMTMSLLYMINSGLYAYHGNGDRGLQINEVLGDVDTFLQKSGLNLEKTSYDELITKYEQDKPFAAKLNNFIADNVVLINEGIIGLTCNAGMIKSGIENRQLGILTSGISAGIGSIVAAFVKDKPMSEQPPEMLNTPWGWAWAKVQESTLLFNGLTNWINSSALATDVIGIYNAVEKNEMNAKMPDDSGNYVKGTYDINAVHEHYEEQFNVKKIALGNLSEKFGTKEHALAQKDLEQTQGDLNHAKRHLNFKDEGAFAYQTTAAMSACYVAATFFSTIAFKEKAVSSDPYEQYAELLTRAAQMAMNAPEGKERDKAIYLMSASLAANPEVKGLNAADINTHINKEIVELQQNPFNNIGNNISKNQTNVAANNIVPISRKPESQISPTAEIDVSKLQKNSPELAQLH